MAPIEELLLAILSHHADRVTELVTQAPTLGATTISTASPLGTGKGSRFFADVQRWLYDGDTPLHLATAGHRAAECRALADALLGIPHTVDVANSRRRATPLHYAADGLPDDDTFDQMAQCATITVLLQANATIDARDASGATPLLRAVRARCAAAVELLLERGANGGAANRAGSTALHLAVQNTGRGGTGSNQARTAQGRIIDLLLEHGADPTTPNAKGVSARAAARSAELVQRLRGDAGRAV